MLDTTAASAVMHRAEIALTKLQAERPRNVVLVAPVVAEIRFGLERLTRGSHRRRLLEGEFARLRQVVRYQDWTEDAADEFGRQKARLGRLGKLIEDFDLAIGAIAVVLDARLATMNIKHMSRIQGLVVDDWAVPGP